MSTLQLCDASGTPGSQTSWFRQISRYCASNLTRSLLQLRRNPFKGSHCKLHSARDWKQPNPGRLCEVPSPILKSPSIFEFNLDRSDYRRVQQIGARTRGDFVSAFRMPCQDTWPEQDPKDSTSINVFDTSAKLAALIFLCRRYCLSYGAEPRHLQ